LLLVLTVLSLALVWSSHQRLRRAEQEMARRQQDIQTQWAQSHLIAKQAQDTTREMAAKVTLLETRVAEVALQRAQLEDLIQSLTRSRDENLVVELDASLRVAQQQSSITGSTEPLLIALKQVDERLARRSQPRLEAIRRAVARDLERIKSVSVADLSALSIKLDEVSRLVDELPMLFEVRPLNDPDQIDLPLTKPAQPALSASATSTASLWRKVLHGWRQGVDAAINEVRSLVRVTRIDYPDAALLAPEQAFFVRENLKLRLLNARLALLSRQFDTTQNDLRVVQTLFDRYFDRNSKRTLMAIDLIRQVAAASHSTSLPRLDETLAALSTAAAGR
jgi:uroporphyrin-III C-methyltransferase